MAGYEWLAITGLVAVAFAVRLVVLVRWSDAPGDGPVRAFLAYWWSRSPYFATEGTWPPGFLYLAGAFSYVVRDPLISTRILNLVLGTLTVFAFYLLTRRTFGRLTALLSTSILAALPLHIGLSSSSLSEASALFELTAGTYLLVRAADVTERRGWYLASALPLICLAEMTRYEVWALTPLFAAYYFIKTRHWPATVSIVGILLAFPLFWLAGNIVSTGAVFRFGRAIQGGFRSSAVGSSTAIKVIWHVAVTQIQRVLPAFIGVGVIWELSRIARRDVTPERGLYLAILSVLWAEDAGLTLLRGPRMWDRLYLASLALALPFVFWPLVLRAKPRWAATTAVFCVAVGSMVACGVAATRVSSETPFSPVFVTQQRPTDIAQLAQWLRRGPYRTDAVLLTNMEYRSTYLFTYFPEIGPHFAVDPEIQYAFGALRGCIGRRSCSLRTSTTLPDFLRHQRPALLLTSVRDKEEWPRLGELLGHEVPRQKPLYAAGGIEVYSLR